VYRSIQIVQAKIVADSAKDGASRGFGFVEFAGNRSCIAFRVRSMN
jgi:hypothetical protein